MKNKWQSFYEKGLVTEDRFIEMIGDSFIRRATRSEDRNEHWDILCKEGKIDVKGKKKNNRRDANVDSTIHYYEFKNVAGNIGWGVPTKVDRMIAFETDNDFILVNPVDIYDDLKLKCSVDEDDFFKLKTRNGRDDLFAKIPTQYLRDYSCGTVNTDGIRLHD